MLGILRFTLALLVFISHIPNIGLKLNPGVSSVIIFYFISGYLMALSYRRFKERTSRPILAFYIDRVMKLFPQYLIVVTATFVLIAILGKSENIIFMNQDPNIVKVILNLALLPVNYVFPPFIIEQLLPHPIIPPAWSLATEFHFYMLLPIIATLSKRSFLVVACATLLLHVTSLFMADGDINSNTFGYRYIFGVLSIFLLGYSYAHWVEPFFRKLVTTVWCIYASVLLLIGPIGGALENPFFKEVLIGVLLTLPIFSYARRDVRSGIIQKIDVFLGRLAYPIFISHFLSFYICDKVFNINPSDISLFFLLSLAICIMLAIALSSVQKMMDNVRFKTRGFKSMAEL